MELTEKRVFRGIAAITCTFCVILAILNLCINVENEPGDLINREMLIILDLLTAIPLGIMIFRPEWLYLFASVCAFHGFMNITDGGDIAGCMLFILAWSVAFKQGFFRTKARFKLALAFALLIIPLALQLRFGIDSTVKSMLNIAFMLLVVALQFVIFRNYLVPLLPVSRKKPQIILADYELMPRDFDFIARVRDNEKYSSIARDYKISESAIKQRMVTVYRKLGVADRSEFLVFCNSVELVFPPEKAEPGDDYETAPLKS
jgi:DNA-binding CsgD family transcriptional regulator